MERLKCPFPYFGGKSKVAPLIWDALGQPKHYIEPFFGSGAVLLNRPDYVPRMVETVNDKDGFVANVWRSLQFSPDETARWCDWPVNHADLTARKKELIKNEKSLIEGLIADPKWHDPILAGYWIWAASCWIGTGLTRLGRIPHISNGGKGVHAHFNTNIFKWFRELSERLRYVRVVCGEWTRVCGGNWQDKMGDIGMFFDPPYGVEDRDTKIYHHDSTSIAKDVMEWCRERGKLKSYRIVLAGYEEYAPLLSEGWTQTNWKAGLGYAKSDNQNRKRETLYFSPYCLKEKQDFFK